jgi:hypothetical protein
MIPDIAIMLAVYMCARLIRSLFIPKERKSTETNNDSATINFYLPDVIDVLAVIAIAFLGYHVYTLGSQVTDNMNKAGLPNFSNQTGP